MRYSEELLQEYREIRKAGFLGTVPEFINYRENYGKENRERHSQVVNYAVNPFTDDDIPF